MCGRQGVIIAIENIEKYFGEKDFSQESLCHLFKFLPFSSRLAEEFFFAFDVSSQRTSFRFHARDI